MNSDRDRILEQALKHELRTADAPVTPACLDAETLAAWEDGGLDAAAMELAEVHLSTCARCQALAGTMARAIPVTVPVKSVEPFRLWKWWLAPIAAATAAVTVWMVVPAEREAVMAPPQAKASQESRSLDKVESSSPIAQPAFKDSGFAQERAAADAAPAQAHAPAAPEQQREPEKQRDRLADQVQPRVDAPAAPLEEPKRQENLEAKKEDADRSKLMKEKPMAAAESAAAAGAAPAPAAPAPAPAPASATAALQKSARFAAAPVEVVSPDSRRRWRIVATGVEHSTDAGATWIPVRAASNEVVTGGVAVSGTGCWLIGRNGLVLVTVDGMTFAKVDLPERVDVATIDATDARSATVTTTTGRTFRTDDSGRTWRRN